MAEHAIAPADVVERERIRDCLARYCQAIDRRDADLLRSCYWPDAVDDHATFVGTVDAFVTYAMDSLAAMIHTQHNLGHILIRLDGDTAVSQSLLTAYHRMDIGEDQRDVTLGGAIFRPMGKARWRMADHPSGSHCGLDERFRCLGPTGPTAWRAHHLSATMPSARPRATSAKTCSPGARFDRGHGWRPGAALRGRTAAGLSPILPAISQRIPAGDPVRGTPVETIDSVLEHRQMNNSISYQVKRRK